MGLGIHGTLSHMVSEGEAPVLHAPHFALSLPGFPACKTA